MKYTTLGQSGLLVSRLAFGAMTFGSGNNPSVYKVDDSAAQQLVDRALDAERYRSSASAGGRLLLTASCTIPWLAVTLMMRRFPSRSATKSD